MKSDCLIGVVPRTSLDGVDVVLVTIDETIVAQQVNLTWPIPAHAKQAILDICQGQQLILSQLSQLDAQLDYLSAEVMNALLTQEKLKLQDIVAAGCYGQTVQHESNGAAPHTLQIGDSNQIVMRTRITVVGDFRRRDIVLDGQGVPLAPASHQALLAHSMGRRMVLSIGRIASLSLLIPQQPVRGYDTGPGNVLTGVWIWRQYGQLYDRDAQQAISGTVIPSLLQSMPNDPYFSAPTPESTDRRYFNYDWVERHLAQFPGISPRDVQTMLAKLTAVTISEQALLNGGRDRFMVYGGGSRGPPLMMHPAALLPGTGVTSANGAGISGDDMEALTFARLAWRMLAGLPGNLPSVTGTSELSILGAIYPANPRTQS